MRKALNVALVDCEVKQRIIEDQELAPVDEPDATVELMALAFTYSDHPDERREWAPSAGVGRAFAEQDGVAMS